MSDIEKETKVEKRKQKQVEMLVIEDDDFSFEGFQVARGELFAHTFEPSITFSDCKVYVNMACIRKFPEFSYIQILVNPEKKKLAVRPCAEEEKDSFRWCSATEKRTPKQITCRIFFAKVFTLMGWDPNHRYKILGKLIKTKKEMVFVFDLTGHEVYDRKIGEDGKRKSSRIPKYPAEWRNQFGVPVSDHEGSLLINIFDESAVFGMEKDPKGTTTKEVISTIEPGSEVEKYEQLSIIDTVDSAGTHNRSQEETAPVV